jgi:hypothetical protein
MVLGVLGDEHHLPSSAGPFRPVASHASRRRTWGGGHRTAGARLLKGQVGVGPAEQEALCPRAFARGSTEFAGRRVGQRKQKSTSGRGCRSLSIGDVSVSANRRFAATWWSFVSSGGSAVTSAGRGRPT